MIAYLVFRLFQFNRLNRNRLNRRSRQSCTKSNSLLDLTILAIKNQKCPIMHFIIRKAVSIHYKQLLESRVMWSCVSDKLDVKNFPHTCKNVSILGVSKIKYNFRTYRSIDITDWRVLLLITTHLNFSRQNDRTCFLNPISLKILKSALFDLVNRLRGLNSCVGCLLATSKVYHVETKP